MFGELFIDVPARLEIVVLAAVVELMSDGEKEYKMIAIGVTFCKMLNDRVLCEHGAQGRNGSFEVLQVLCERRVRFGITHRGDAVVFDLTHTLAGDAILLPDGIKRASLALSGKAEAVREDAARALRKACEEILGDRFWLKR